MLVGCVFFPSFFFFTYPVSLSPLDSLQCVTSISFSYWTTPNQSTVPQVNTTGDDCRGRITYLGMLAKLLHPRRQLFFGTGSHCWLMANFFPTRTPKCSPLDFQKAHISQLALFHWVTLSRGRTWLLPLLNVMKLCQPIVMRSP